MSNKIVVAKPQPDPGEGETLQRYTSARVSLGHAGPAIPTHEQLRFQLDHALARDAVHTQLDVTSLLQELQQRQMECLALRSAAASEPGQNDRRLYLRRPDLGRTLHPDSTQALLQHTPDLADKPEIAIVIADGLSALAVERHALPLLDAFIQAIEPNPWRIGPICIVSQGRVAIGDEIGQLLQAKLTILLIGERPGLSAPDSLGVYITWNPRPGRTDAERNCISNIRREGLSYEAAAQRIVFYAKEAKRLQATGISLKDNTELFLA
jgi:ethanolamine ammonia-lyase small subunit